jgi:4-diphosphocytidyl-2-methyl-D-erithritol synthase
MNVVAVVVAGGRAGAMDTLVPVGDVPMVARAVRCLIASGLVNRVVVVDVDSRRDRVLHACSGLDVSVHDGLRRALFPVRTHAGQRAGAAAGDAVITNGVDDVVLIHDAARPLAPTALAMSVVEAVRSGHALALPVLPLADTVKQVDRGGIVRATPDRAGLRVAQTPFAVRRDLLDPELADSPLTLAAAHAAAGGAVHTVAGHPLAFAVRSAWDLQLAELLVERDDP